MHDNELWQVYADNGNPIDNDGRSQDEFKSNHELIMGNAHIWLWKKLGDDKVEVLLQQRSISKSSKPGWLHISAGGHIDKGETALEAAVREAKEEMGLGH